MPRGRELAALWALQPRGLLQEPRPDIYIYIYIYNSKGYAHYRRPSSHQLAVDMKIGRISKTCRIGSIATFEMLLLIAKNVCLFSLVFGSLNQMFLKHHEPQHPPQSRHSSSF